MLITIVFLLAGVWVSLNERGVCFLHQDFPEYQNCVIAGADFFFFTM